MTRGIMTQEGLDKVSKEGNRAAKNLDRLMNEPGWMRIVKKYGPFAAGGLITVGILYGLSELS